MKYLIFIIIVKRIDNDNISVISFFLGGGGGLPSLSQSPQMCISTEIALECA